MRTTCSVLASDGPGSERTGGRGRWTKESPGRTTCAVLATNGAGEGLSILGKGADGQKSGRGGQPDLF